MRQNCLTLLRLLLASARSLLVPGESCNLACSTAEAPLSVKHFRQLLKQLSFCHPLRLLHFGL